MPNKQTSKEAPGTALRKLKPEIAPGEAKAIERLSERQHDRGPAPKLKLKDQDGNVTVSNDHSDPSVGSLLLMQAIGTTDFEFADGLVGQLVNAGMPGKGIDERGPNFMLAVVQAIQPRDEVESMLASQMAAVQMATMTFARRLAHCETIAQQDSAERAFNRLARTFTTQMEALKRYRSTGQQTVTVQHVNVNDGGQAIVGNVSHGGGAGKKSKRQPHAQETLTHAPGGTVPGEVEAKRPSMSRPGRSRA